MCAITCRVCVCLFFNMSAGNPNSDLRACTAGTSPAQCFLCHFYLWLTIMSKVRLSAPRTRVLRETPLYPIEAGSEYEVVVSPEWV